MVGIDGSEAHYKGVSGDFYYVLKGCMALNSEWTTRTLATNLKHYRSELGLTQREVAEQAGVSYRLVQELEGASGNPTIETLCQIATLFKVTINTLLELRFLRLSETDDDFIDRYKREFKTARIAACLRSLDGVTIWGNAQFSKINGSGHSFDKGPVDVLELFSGESRGVLRQQLSTERNRYAAPYTIAHDRSKGDRRFIRCYPTLILPHRGRTAAFTSVYKTEMSEDCTLNYYEYCRLLLSAGYP